MEFRHRILDKTANYFALENNLRVLLITNVIANLSGSLWTSLLGLYITNNLGVSVLMFGLMNTIRDSVSSLVNFPSGFLSDNFGRRKMIMLSTFLSILTLIILLFVRDLPLLLLVSIFHGLSMAFMGPSQSAYVIDVVQEGRRGRAYATLALFQSLSSIIATSIAGILAVIYGFYWVFGIALILESLSLGGITFYLRESRIRDPVETRPSKESIYKHMKNGLTMLRSPPLLAVLFGIVFHQLGLGIQGPFLTLYASDVLILSLPSISLILSMEQTGIFVGHFPSGRIVDKYGGEISFAFHIFITSLAMILFTITRNPVLVSLVLFGWGLTFGLDNVSRQKLIAKYKSESGVAMAFGVISLIAGVISLISPTIGGWVWTEFTPQTVFYTSAVTNVLGSLPLFILWLHNRNAKASLT